MKSRTVWAIAVLFIYNGLQAVAPQIADLVPALYGPLLQIAINSILAALSIYFRLKPKQVYK